MQQPGIPRLLTLPDGMRCLVAESSAHTAYVGILVGVGTRHETDAESGMAHLVEHMSFKGTERRSAMQVINRIETVGGELNAYTGKEETVYYAACLPEHVGRTVELLCDIVFHSTYPEAELAREVEVVCDEIESYEDSPSELIYDSFDAMLFPSMPLGRNILGHAERLRQFTSRDLHGFTQRHYRPQNAILYIHAPAAAIPKALLRNATPLSPETRDRKSQQQASCTPTLPTAATAPQLSPTVIHRSTHQAHVIIGAQAFPLSDPRHMAMTLLSNILGGPGMNSRLNLALREKRGLVYTVESSIAAYTDTGVWTTYFGCDAHDVRRCLRLVGSELRRLTDAPPTARQLAAAKRQLCGQLTIAYDNVENRAISMAKRYYLTGQTLTLRQICDAIADVTPELMLQTARDVFAPEALRTLIFD